MEVLHNGSRVKPHSQYHFLQHDTRQGNACRVLSPAIAKVDTKLNGRALLVYVVLCVALHRYKWYCEWFIYRIHCSSAIFTVHAHTHHARACTRWYEDVSIVQCPNLYESMPSGAGGGGGGGTNILVRYCQFEYTQMVLHAR